MFAGFSVEASQPTSIVGEITDQSDLFSILDRMENLGLQLISINPLPD